MSKRLLLASVIAVSATLCVPFVRLMAQSSAPAAERLEFDAASIKPNNSAIPRVMLQFPGGRLNGVNITVLALLGLGYRVQPFQLVGAPEWISSERYDVTATSTITPTPDQRASMVQALLADRFKLAIHRETRDLPAYALVLARNDGGLGSRIRKSDLDCAALAAAARGNPPPAGLGPDARGPIGRGPAAPGQTAQTGQVQMQMTGCGTTGGRGGQRTSRGVTMAEFATSLSGLVNRVVLDRTGLAGGCNGRPINSRARDRSEESRARRRRRPPPIRRSRHCLRRYRSSSASSWTHNEARSRCSSSIALKDQLRTRRGV